MKVVTPDEMRETDGRAVRDFGISEEILMERAGMAVSRVCREWLHRLPFRSGRRPVLAVAGGGHNGADSLVALRDLVSLGYPGEALVVVKEERFRPWPAARTRSLRESMAPAAERRANSSPSRDVPKARAYGPVWSSTWSTPKEGIRSSISGSGSMNRLSLIPFSAHRSENGARAFR